MIDAVKTLTIDNFRGTLTRYDKGKVNSGFAKYATTNSMDPFTSPGNLNWFEAPVPIDPTGAVITDLIVAMKERVEAGVSYVYAIGHTARLYKIQVNDPTTYNPSYDNPVLLATLTLGTPTFTRGGSIDFYGSTERIYIGHDKGVTQIDFAGTNEAVVGVAPSWTQTVPRPIKQFVGKMYVGNGSNIAEIDSTLTVTSYTKLSPGLSNNTQVRDIDTSTDGNYLEMVVSRLALPDITSTAQDTTFISNSDSYIFKWNGIDAGATSFDTFPSFSLNANVTFGSMQYTFGYDLAGSAVFAPTEKILSPILSQAPLPNAVGSNGNIIGWTTVESSPATGTTKLSQFIYGSLDSETGVGWWRQSQMSATSPETDVIRVPCSLIVSNLLIGPSSNGYAGGVAGAGKMYFSTLESSSSPTTKYRLYRFFLVPTGVLPSSSGVYETQTELFSKKIEIKEVRVYNKPLVASNSFKIDLIGSDGNSITNSSKTFTVGSNVTAGDDREKYNPQMQPTYALGLRISNLGTVNWTCLKVEIDYKEVNN